LSAIERVEVLTDGASALYGADAVAGVVNLITKKSSEDFTLTAGVSHPTGGGAEEQRLSLSKGIGNYATDGYNISFALSMDKRGTLAATQRDFAKTGLVSYKDELGQVLAVDTSLATSKRSVPANLNLYYIDAVDGFSQLDRLNPAVVENGACPPFHIQAGSGCRYDFTSQLEIYPDRERTNGYISFDKDLGQGLKWFGEVLIANTKSTARIAPPPGELAIPIGTVAYTHALAIATAAGYSAGTATDGSTFLADQLDANLRFTELGQRTNINEQSLVHLSTGLEGTYKDWDYSANVIHSENTAKDTFGGGYASVSGVAGAVLNGFDPFLPIGAQSTAGKAAIEAAKIDGYWNGGKTTFDAVNFQASREVGKLEGGAIQAAVGGTFNREVLDARTGPILGGRTTYATDADGNPCSVTGLPCVGTGIDQRFGDTGIQPAYTASRNTLGLFGELALPVTKKLELTTSARVDNTSDFGKTINGKVAARFQPSKQLLLRGSFGTGYIAPSLAQVNAPKQNFGVTQGGYNCSGNPEEVALQTLATQLGVLCDTGAQFNQYAKGNLDLQPEKSKQATLGVFWELTPTTSVSADLWTVHISDAIGQISEQVAFSDPAKYSRYFTDFTDPSTGKKLLAFIAPNENLGNSITTGIDFTANSRLDVGPGKLTSTFIGTFMLKSVAQAEKNGQYFSDLENQDEQGTISFRWKGKWINTFDIGKWSNSLTTNFQSGYLDYATSPVIQTGVNAGNESTDYRVKVEPFVTFDWQTTYNPTKAISLTAGVLNLTNMNPPFVFSQGGLNRGQEVGWDGRYFDPRGRTVYLNGTLKF
jgi:iron complex outermembrane receptor protein